VYPSGTGTLRLRFASALVSNTPKRSPYIALSGREVARSCVSAAAPAPTPPKTGSAP